MPHILVEALFRLAYAQNFGVAFGCRRLHTPYRLSPGELGVDCLIFRASDQRKFALSKVALSFTFTSQRRNLAVNTPFGPAIYSENNRPIIKTTQYKKQFHGGSGAGILHNTPKTMHTHRSINKSHHGGSKSHLLSGPPFPPPNLVAHYSRVQKTLKKCP
jgi:hypothetical protein